jgi:hypothetical protein
VVSVEQDWEDPELDVERCLEASSGGLSLEDDGDDDRHPREQLRDPDGRDREDEAGGPAEPADDEHIDHRADERRPDQAQADGQEVVPVELDHELDRDDRSDPAELRL